MTKQQIADHFRQRKAEAEAAGDTAIALTPQEQNPTEILDVTGSHVVVRRAAPSGGVENIGLDLLAKAVRDALDGQGRPIRDLTPNQRGPLAALLNDLPATRVIPDRAHGPRGPLTVHRAPDWEPEPLDLTEVQDVDLEVLEGRRVSVTHVRYERDPKVVADKRRAVLEATGKLACEVCGFDSGATYGPNGDGFCEVHHRNPLFNGERATSLADLAVVCANCHRIVHRAGLSVQALHLLVTRRRETHDGT